MDIHPPGFPGLVGPEGGDFSHFDYSSHFRVLPNNSSADAPSAGQDNVALRSHLQSLHLQASPPTSTIVPRLSQPLRIGDDNGKNHNGNLGGKSSSPRTHYLISDSVLPPLGSPPNKRIAHSLSSPARLFPSEVKEDDEELPVSSAFDHNGEPLYLSF